MSIGIGIVTYNRLAHLQRVLEAVFTYTASPFHIVVADDGSTDGTRAFAEKAGVTVVGSKNVGIARNKNRALYTLRHEADSRVIIMLEDDTLPVELGWEQLWVKTVKQHGYATYAHPKMGPALISGSGTPDDPYACLKITSQCSAVGRKALDTVGYFDTRFQGYGIEDGEWTTRLRRSGYGILKVPQGDTYQKANCMILGGVETLDADSYRDRESVTRNRELSARITHDPIPRPVWRSDEEKNLLKAEIEDAIGRVPLLLQPGRPGVVR